MATPFEELLQAFRQDVTEIAEAMAAGRVGNSPYGADEFREDMARSLAEFHTAAFMLGQGRTKLRSSDLPLLGKLIQEQFDYLDKFVGQIDQDGWVDRFERRALMYVESIKTSFSAGATKGLPLPAYPAQGTECRTNCGCSWRIEEVDAASGDYDCYWERGKDDSCPTCLDRAGEWAPFRIRGGKPE